MPNIVSAEYVMEGTVSCDHSLWPGSHLLKLCGALIDRYRLQIVHVQRLCYQLPTKKPLLLLILSYRLSTCAPFASSQT